MGGQYSSNKRTHPVPEDFVSAIRDGNSIRLKSLIKARGDVNFCQQTWGLLHFAAVYGRDAFLDVLIKPGANVYAGGSNGTPLTCAAQNNHVRCLHVLLKAGAFVNASNLDQGRSTALMLAADNGYVNCLRFLIRAGADVNMIDVRGDTVLNRMAAKGDVLCMDLLIEAGADVNSVNQMVLHPHGRLQGVVMTKTWTF